jgi:hypothetical protein
MNKQELFEAAWRFIDDNKTDLGLSEYRSFLDELSQEADMRHNLTIVEQGGGGKNKPDEGGAKEIPQTPRPDYAPKKEAPKEDDDEGGLEGGGSEEEKEEGEEVPDESTVPEFPNETNKRVKKASLY